MTLGCVVPSNEMDYLRALRAEFQEGPQSFNLPAVLPAARQYRFQRDDQRVLLWLEGENARRPARGCTLSASTPDSLRALAEFIQQEVPNSAPFVGETLAARMALDTRGVILPDTF